LNSPTLCVVLFGMPACVGNVSEKKLIIMSSPTSEEERHERGKAVRAELPSCSRGLCPCNLCRRRQGGRTGSMAVNHVLEDDFASAHTTSQLVYLFLDLVPTR
jgi:hypothetical protein